MSQLEASTQKAFDALGGAGKAITGFALAGAGALGLATNTAADFEAQMSKVGAIAGASSTQLDALRKSALDLGSSTSMSASEVATAQKELAALGFTVEDILGSMPGVISAAEAAGADMAQTAEVMASTLNIFGLEASQASKVADILAQTANQSAADITDMQYALKYAGPPAAALGVSLEELSASIGILSDAGMGGEQAGTTLRGALLALLNPSEKNSKLMESLGIAVTDTKGNFVGLSGLIENISASMEGMTDTQKAANLASIVGTEAVSGMLSLMAAGPDTIDKMTKSLQNSAGASAETAAKMKDNLKGTMDQLSGAVETASISIGTALIPTFRSVAESLSGIIEKFNGLSPQMKNFIAMAGLASVAFGLFLGPLLMLIPLIPSITTGLAAIAGLLKITTAQLLIGSAVVAGVVLAIAALGVAFYLAYQKIDWFRNGVDSAWAWIKSAFKTSLDFIKGVVVSVMSSVSQFFGEQLGAIKKFWNDNGSSIMQLVKFYFTSVKANIEVAMSAIKAVFMTVWPIISGAVQIAWGVIKAVIAGSIQTILGIITVATKLLQGDWKGAWNAIKDTTKNIGESIIGYLKDINLREIGRNIIQGLVNGISGMMGTVKAKIQEIASIIPKGIKDMLDINSPIKKTSAKTKKKAAALALILTNSTQKKPLALKAVALI
ncbi:phage tail tape measure protein [Heyndrickxia sp. MSNUG]|uniref:phage tail tape measure protein n=1 Tax=Heyndrickxia sp. MSNUG TaxID=3136677 RepID=UPI003C304181